MGFHDGVDLSKGLCLLLQPYLVLLPPPFPYAPCPVTTLRHRLSPREPSCVILPCSHSCGSVAWMPSLLHLENF